MSISAKPWDSAGGGASSDTLNDVTGRGATTGNSIQVGGLNIAGNYAMPSADGSVNQVLQTNGSGSLSFTTISVTGGLTYKGTYYLSSPADLSSAVKGDFYIIQGIGTLYGKDWSTGDHLVVNADMGGSVSNGKIDKVDNTDIVTSVNALTGPVVLNGTNVDGDYSASNYSTTSDKIEKHLEGIDNKFGTLGTASTKDTGVANGNVIVADATGLPVIDGSQLTGITATDATKLAIANNLSDLNNVGTARTNLGLGTASTSASSDFLAVSNNLSDLNNAGTARTNLGLGTASVKDTGVANGNVIVADATGLPVIDGSQLTGITATDATKLAIANNLSDLNSASTARTNLGLGTASVKDTGVANGNVIVADATGLPVIDGSQLTGVTGTDATKLAIANNLSDLNNAGTARTNLGLGTASTSASTDFLAVSNNLSDLNNAGTARTNLGLVIGTDVAPIASPALTGSPTAPTQSASDNSTKVATTAYVDAAVVAGGGLSSVVQDTSPELGGDLDVSTYDIKTTSGNAKIGLEAHGTGFTELRGNTTGGNNPGAIRFNCEQNSHGVILKSPLHADYDAANDYTLTLPTGLPASDKVLQSTSSGVLSWVAQSATDATKLAILNNLSDLDNAGTARTNLGLVIGTNVQAYDLGLTSIASLTTAADKMLYTDGSDSYAVTGLTSAGRALLDDANASAQRTTLGLVIGTDVSAIASPAFTGSPTAPTQSQSDGSTKLATTAYVDTAVAGASGGGYTYSAKTSSFTAAADYHYSCTNAITATLPAASSNANKPIRIKVMGTDTVTIGRNGSDKIDGVASDYSMTIQYSSITLFSNGSDGWEII